MQDCERLCLVIVFQDIVDHVTRRHEQSVRAYIETRPDQLPFTGIAVRDDWKYRVCGIWKRSFVIRLLEVPAIGMRFPA